MYSAPWAGHALHNISSRTQFQLTHGLKLYDPKLRCDLTAHPVRVYTTHQTVESGTAKRKNLEEKKTLEEKRMHNKNKCASTGILAILCRAKCNSFTYASVFSNGQSGTFRKIYFVVLVQHQNFKLIWLLCDHTIADQELVMIVFYHLLYATWCTTHSLVETHGGGSIVLWDAFTL